MRAGSQRSKSAGARMRSSARKIGRRKRAGRSAWPSKQPCSRLLQPLRRRSGECLRSVAALPAGTRRRRPASPRQQRRRQLRRPGRRRRCRNALPRSGAKRKPRRGCKKVTARSPPTRLSSPAEARPACSIFCPVLPPVGSVAPSGGPTGPAHPQSPSSSSLRTWTSSSTIYQCQPTPAPVAHDCGSHGPFMV